MLLQRIIYDKLKCSQIFFFFFGCVGSSQQCTGLFVAVHRRSLVAESGGYSHCTVWASLCGGFSCCRALALGHMGFSSCGAWAQLPHGIWDPSSQIRDETHFPCIVRPTPNHWITREVPRYSQIFRLREPKYKGKCGPCIKMHEMLDSTIRKTRAPWPQ